MVDADSRDDMPLPTRITRAVREDDLVVALTGPHHTEILHTHEVKLYLFYCFIIFITIAADLHKQFLAKNRGRHSLYNPILNSFLEARVQNQLLHSAPKVDKVKNQEQFKPVPESPTQFYNLSSSIL